jgi:hypothetical protein
MSLSRESAGMDSGSFLLLALVGGYALLGVPRLFRALFFPDPTRHNVEVCKRRLEELQAQVTEIQKVLRDVQARLPRGQEASEGIVGAADLGK